jgi:hypothetical protein
MDPDTKPFDHDIALNVVHTSANQLGRWSNDARAIDIDVLAAPASLHQHHY